MQHPSRWTPMAVLSLALGLVLAILAPATASALPLAFVAMGDTTLISQAQEVLKIVFDEPFFDNVVADSEFGDVFEEGGNIKYDETTGGRYVENLHELSWPAGVGARLEDDYIPTADPGEYANSRVYLKRVFGTIQMSSAVMERVRSQEGAYFDYMERALPLLQKRITSERDRMLLGWGYAVKAKVVSKSAYNTPVAGQFQIVVGDAMGVTGWGNAILQFLRGERIGFTASLTAPIALRNAGSGQSARVKNVQIQTNTLTLEGSSALHAAVTAGDFIGAADQSGSSFPAGNPAETKEITGVIAGVDDGNIVATYMNIPRANNDYWQGNMIDAQAAPFSGSLTESLLVYADRVTSVNGGGKVNLLVVNRVGEEQYWNSLKNDRVFVDPRGNYEGGKGDRQMVRLNGRVLPLQVARKLPFNIALGLETDAWKIFRLSSWNWDDRTGSMWNRVIDSTGPKSAYYASGYYWEEAFCGAPQHNFRVNNLIEQIGS